MKPIKMVVMLFIAMLMAMVVPSGAAAAVEKLPDKVAKSPVSDNKAGVSQVGGADVLRRSGH